MLLCLMILHSNTAKSEVPHLKQPTQIQARNCETFFANSAKVQSFITTRFKRLRT